MNKTTNVFSRLLGACACLGLSCCAFFIQGETCQAKLIIGFEFPSGGTNQLVPQTGGTYTVNIVARTDNLLTTNLGFLSGYIGALSQVLQGSTIGGDITASAIAVLGLQGSGSNVGTRSDLNADGHIDLGLANGSPRTSLGWLRPFTGNTTPVLLGGPSGVLGTFSVTIPAHSSQGLEFLRYLPQLDPGTVGADFSWSENNTTSVPISGSVTGTGAGFVITGSSVTFTAVPEPATWSLLAVTLGTGCCWRRRN